jgi:hypothetical protein
MPTGRVFRVAIDDATLRANLAREQQRVVTDREVRRWLRAAGFKLLGHHWLVCECDLGHLETAEVLSAEILEDVGTRSPPPAYDRN